jgi:hypothetical protein
MPTLRMDTNFSITQLTRYNSSNVSTFEEDQFIFIGGVYSKCKNDGSHSEDASFMTEKGVGVSDGVGGWSSYGINSSLFSNTLMKECQKFISRVMNRHQRSIIDPRVSNQEMECHRQAYESKTY